MFFMRRQTVNVRISNFMEDPMKPLASTPLRMLAVVAALLITSAVGRAQEPGKSKILDVEGMTLVVGVTVGVSSYGADVLDGPRPSDEPLRTASVALERAKITDQQFTFRDLMNFGA